MIDDTVNFLRGKLYPDAYADQTARQNFGEYCSHCDTLLGHRGHCPLLNRQAAETESANRHTDFTAEDIAMLAGMKIVL